MWVKCSPLTRMGLRGYTCFGCSACVDTCVSDTSTCVFKLYALKPLWLVATLSGCNVCPPGLKDPPNYKYCVSLLMLVYSLVESEVMSGFQTWRVCSRVLCSGSLDGLSWIVICFRQCPSCVHTCSHVRCAFLVLFTHANKHQKNDVSVFAQIR